MKRPIAQLIIGCCCLNCSIYLVDYCPIDRGMCSTLSYVSVVVEFRDQ